MSIIVYGKWNGMLYEERKADAGCITQGSSDKHHIYTPLRVYGYEYVCLWNWEKEHAWEKVNDLVQGILGDDKSQNNGAGKLKTKKTSYRWCCKTKSKTSLKVDS